MTLDFHPERQCLAVSNSQKWWRWTENEWFRQRLILPSQKETKTLRRSIQLQILDPPLTKSDSPQSAPNKPMFFVRSPVSIFVGSPHFIPRRPPRLQPRPLRQWASQHLKNSGRVPGEQVQWARPRATRSRPQGSLV